MTVQRRRSKLGICCAARCPEFVAEAGKSYCEAHEPAPWRGREARRGPTGNSRQRHALVLKKHKGICHVCGRSGATEVDHVVPKSSGGSDEPFNLRPICKVPCHKNKTQAEAAEARRRLVSGS